MCACACVLISQSWLGDSGHTSHCDLWFWIWNKYLHSYHGLKQQPFYIFLLLNIKLLYYYFKTGQSFVLFKSCSQDDTTEGKFCLIRVGGSSLFCRYGNWFNKNTMVDLKKTPQINTYSRSYIPFYFSKKKKYEVGDLQSVSACQTTS